MMRRRWQTAHRAASLKSGARRLFAKVPNHFHAAFRKHRYQKDVSFRLILIHDANMVCRVRGRIFLAADGEQRQIGKCRQFIAVRRIANVCEKIHLEQIAYGVACWGKD